MIARLSRRRADSGMTLVELLISMILLSIVLSLATGAIIKALDQNSNLTQQSEAQNRNNTGMEQLTRALRQAVLPKGGTTANSSVITVASPTQIQFTTRLQGTAQMACSSNCTFANAAVQVGAQFNTTTHTLQWGTGAESSSCVGTCTYAAPTINKTLVNGVRNDGGSTVCPANTGGTAVFKYWYVDATGNLAAWSTSVAAPYNTTSSISVVQIDLWTQTQTGPQTPACVNLTDYVQLRNWK